MYGHEIKQQIKHIILREARQDGNHGISHKNNLLTHILRQSKDSVPAQGELGVVKGGIGQ